MTTASPTHRLRHPVAVIGMGCFFPKSPGLKEYWRLLYHGVDAIEELPETHWSPADYFDSDARKPDRVYCKRGGFLPQVPFDPTAFGIPPANLESTDTSQILGLMAARRALEDAGYGNGKPFDRDRTSVVLGVTGTQELVIPLGARLDFPKWRSALEAAGVAPEKTREVIDRIGAQYPSWQENSFPGLLGNVVAGRICNRLDLNGTNCVVDAACASSLSALNLALLELEAGRSDMVVTGGVDTLNDIFMHMCFARTQILSATGDARPFSRDADGTVLGEGVGLLVLKRLEDAEADGDRVYAVIRGIGSSSDGKAQSIYAPLADGQEKALRKAYAAAGVDPASVGLVEAHGTGTRVGDKIEIQALKAVFGSRNGSGRCAVGSVKSMIGHTKAAAGSAGLIKAVLALHHKVLPPTLKVSEADPELRLEESPFYLNRQSSPWFASGKEPRRAGVSAFGFGGSNFHVVLEEFQKGRTDVSWDGSVEVVAIGADSREALAARLAECREALAAGPVGETLPVLASETRAAFSADARHRLVMVTVFDRGSGQWDTSSVLEDAAALLDGGEEADFQTRGGAFLGTGPRPGRLAFAFPGQGSQYCGMGRDLVAWFPEALAVMDRANGHFEGEGSLTDIVYPPAADTPEAAAAQEDRLRDTAVAQPALGAAGLAMAAVLERFGVRPEGACGHSYGELAALCAAGWIDEPTLHRLSNLRGRLMAAAGGGTMAAVKAPLEDIDALIASEKLDVVLANRNTPNQGVLSGSVAAVEAAEKAFKARKMRAIRLQVSAAFHSELVESARRPFAEALEEVPFTPTGVPVYANTTGKAYPADPGEIRSLLGNHLRNAVNFVDEVRTLHADGFRVFLEVGPRTVMKGLVSATLKGEPHHAVALDASGGKRFGIEDLARALAHLAALGHPVDLGQWESGSEPPPPRRMSLPVSGANPRPRSAAPTRREPDGPAPRAATPAPPAAAPTPEPPALEAEPVRAPAAPTPARSAAPPAPTAAAPDCPSDLQAAFSAVEAGIRSMESIHLQTARAHEAFLETQAATARAIQDMIAGARNLAGGTSPLPPGPTALDGRSVSPAPPGLPEGPPPVEAAAAPAPPVPEPPPAPAREVAAPTAPPPPPSAGHGVGDALMAVVSELTGYPAEMLSLDMDLEADLGIDSIKRVEILSAMEERFPGLAPASPEDMAGLRTLRQVADAVGPSPAGEAASPAETPSPRPEAVPATAPGAMADTLLAVVSELTGYPAEMLSFDMDLEADLGIDSIKRVEILSAVEERFPGMAPSSPERLSALRTLSEIVGELAPHAGPSAPSPPAATAEGACEAAAVEAALLEIVSGLTGYPAETLQTDMDIEADLGIDSIKRVEILSALEERRPDLAGASPEELAGLRTLSQIAGRLVRQGPPAAAAGDPSPAPRADSPAEPGHRTDPGPPTEVERTAFRAVEAPLDRGRRPAPAPAGRILVTADRSGLSAALCEALAKRGLAAEAVGPEAAAAGAPLSDVAGLVMVADRVDRNGSALPHLDTDPLRRFFSLLQAAGPGLVAHAGKGAFLASVCRMDGAFGFLGGPVAEPIQGGLAGLVKTAAKEWKGVACRALDVDAAWSDLAAAAEAVADEILFRDPAGAVEAGLSEAARRELAPSPGSFPTGGGAGALFKPGDVVVVSGGARGITAAAARALAASGGPVVVLMGRTPAPVPEPEWLSGADDDAAVKRAVLANEFAGRAPRPMELEAASRRWSANRAVARTLAAIAASGGRAEYRCVDIRDRDAVAAALEGVVRDHGPVRALVHGAGILEDRLILEKTPEQFAAVLDTKVGGLANLLAAVDLDRLRHMVLFSSAAARYGNPGQSDYAAANEVLNKAARFLSARLPRCRVLSLNWGPWDGGMVTGSLRRAFLKNGASLIPVAAGVDALVGEMASDAAEVEIVAGSGFPEPRPAPPPASTEPVPGFQRHIDEDSIPVLSHHKLDGKPVLPFALMAEWFAHSALHDNPGLVLTGIDDMRLLKGIVIENGSKHIRLLNGKPERRRDGYAVEVEMRDGLKGDREVVHSRATTLLSEDLPEAPDFRMPPGLSGNGYARPMSDVYRDILFHGEALQGIRKVDHLSAEGVVARIEAAPAPLRWMSDPPRNRWIADPLAMDCAHQMASLWCYEQKGRVALPSYTASYRQYRRSFPEGPIRAVLEVLDATARKLTCDVTFLDGEDRVIATIRGHEAIMDDALIRAFKPGTAAAVR